MTTQAEAQPQVEEGTPQVPPVEAPAVPMDPYDAEEARIAEQLAAEEAEAAPPKEEQAQQPEQPAATEVKGKDEAKVPVSALYKERKARQAAELENARLTGQLQVLAAKQGQEATQEAEPTEQVPQDPLQDLNAQVDALAERFDAGEISMKEFKAAERQLQEQIDAVRDSRRQHETVRTDSDLASWTADLVTRYPAVNKLTVQATEALTNLAYEEAMAEGNPITGSGIAATKALRERIAIIATRLYGGTSPSPGKQTPLSPQAAARAAKLDMQEHMPPDVSTMGSSASGVAPSEAEILSRMERMTDDEAAAYLDSLPAIKQKLTRELFG